jgi:hypothetical protein
MFGAEYGLFDEYGKLTKRVIHWHQEGDKGLASLVEIISVFAGSSNSAGGRGFKDRMTLNDVTIITHRIFRKQGVT